jgi:hypothetical protein
MDQGAPPERVLGRRMLVVGLLLVGCLLGWLARIAQEWAPGMNPPRAVEASPGALSFRDVYTSCGLLDWLGGWSYLASCLWLSLAAYRMLRSRRSQRRLWTSEALLVAGVVVLLILVPSAMWLSRHLIR